MTHANGWPDKERPGYPMFPERDGAHAFRVMDNRDDLIFYWRAKTQEWADFPDSTGHHVHPESYMAEDYYIGPIFTPSELTSLLRAERERCAKVLSRLAEQSAVLAKEARENIDSPANALSFSEISAIRKFCAETIRNLPDEPPCTPS